MCSLDMCTSKRLPWQRSLATCRENTLVKMFQQYMYRDLPKLPKKILASGWRGLSRGPNRGSSYLGPSADVALRPSGAPYSLFQARLQHASSQVGVYVASTRFWDPFWTTGITWRRISLKSIPLGKFFRRMLSLHQLNQRGN